MTLPSLTHLLRVNAAYSATAGLAALAAHDALASALAVPTVVALVLGAGLVGFASGLVFLSTGGRATAAWGSAIAAADGLWVLLVVLFAAVAGATPAGVAVALGSAAPVAVFAVLQAAAAARLRSPAPMMVEVEREVACTADDLWPVMLDHQLYARLAPNLSKVGPFREASDGSVQRRCWDVRGKHWDETRTTWEPGRAYAVEVHTGAADYPYPLAVLRGTWSVRPQASGRATVTMRFELRPEATVSGVAFASVLVRTGPAMMRRILTGWEAEAARRTPSAGGRASSAPRGELLPRGTGGH
jgi:hypothetical protein